MSTAQELMERIESVKTEILRDLHELGTSVWVEGERQDPSKFAFSTMRELIYEGKALRVYQGGIEKIPTMLDVASLVDSEEIKPLKWIPLDPSFHNPR